MPPAASGSESPRDQTKPAGPKRTPRPDKRSGGSSRGGRQSGSGRNSGAARGVERSSTNGTSGSSAAGAETDESGPRGDADGVAIDWDREPVERTAAAGNASTVAPVAPSSTDPTLTAPVPALAQEPAGQAERRPRRRATDAVDDAATAGRRKGRRVRRVIRRIDLWSVLKLAIVLYTCLYAAVMGTLALLWGLAYSSGQIERVQSFMADVGMDNYRFYGDQMWRAAAMIGAIGVLAATIMTVLTAALVNVISEMTGGIRVVVIEEDPPPRRRPADAGR